MPSKRFTGFFDKHGFKILDGSIVNITNLLVKQTVIKDGKATEGYLTKEYEVFWDGSKWKIRETWPDLTVDYYSPPKTFDMPTDHVEYEVVFSEVQKESI